MIARNLLSLPRWLICVAWLGPVLMLSVVRREVDLPSMENLLHQTQSIWPIVISILWAWSLFSVRPPRGAAALAYIAMCMIYPLSLMLVGLAVALTPSGGFWLQDTNTDGQRYLDIWLPISIFLAIGFAVFRLVRFEGRSGWPISWHFALSWFAIFFLPIGIWFLKSRVDEVLAAPLSGDG